LCPNWLLIILCLTAVGVKLCLDMPQLVHQIEQIGVQLMTVIHS